MADSCLFNSNVFALLNIHYHVRTQKMEIKVAEWQKKV